LRIGTWSGSTIQCARRADQPVKKRNIAETEVNLVKGGRAELAMDRDIGKAAVMLPERSRVAPDARDARSDPSLWAAFVSSGNTQ
jgi:hypothetical protein